jgi:transcriptional regulator with XRE-family HTH domain
LPSPTSFVPEEEGDWQTWVAQEAGTLLATPPDLSAERTLQNVCDTVNRGVDLITQGNANAFARRLQVSPSAISCWRLQRQRPQLEVLLRLCHLLGTSLRQVFSQGAHAVLASNCNQVSGPLPPERPKHARRAFEHVRVRLALEQILKDPAEPPPPMRQVCKQLGYENAVIYTYFPELCRAISARYMAYQKERGKQRLQQLCAEVRQKVLIVHQQGIYPSAYRVEALLSVPGFMRHLDARRVWHATLRELGWES